MKTRRRFQIKQGESNVKQGDNIIYIQGRGKYTYLWVGGKGCYGHLSGPKTLENLAYSILKSLHQ